MLFLRATMCLFEHCVLVQISFLMERSVVCRMTCATPLSGKPFIELDSCMCHDATGSG